MANSDTVETTQTGNDETQTNTGTGTTPAEHSGAKPDPEKADQTRIDKLLATVEKLTAKVDGLNHDNTALRTQLRETKTRQDLTDALTQAGCVDVETGVILAQGHAKTDDNGAVTNLDDIIDQLTDTKKFLFNQPVSGVADAWHKTTPGKSHDMNDLLRAIYQG